MPLFKETCESVLDWAERKNLLHPLNAPKQTLKMVSEVGEFCEAMQDGEMDPILDEAGDVVVTLVILGSQLGFDTSELYTSSDDRFDDHSENTLLKAMIAQAGNIADKVCKDLDPQENVQTLVVYRRSVTSIKMLTVGILVYLCHLHSARSRTVKERR